MVYSLFLVTTLHDHAGRTLVATGTVTLGWGTPWRDRYATFARTTFTTTVRVIDWVHGNTTNGRTDTTPTCCTGFTQFAQVVFFVADFANGGATFNVNTANFT
jgi:hypothetical protein